MNTVHLIVKELLHRKLNFFLSVLAIVTAVALFVSFYTTGVASFNETKRLMRNLGYNLRIVPSETDMLKFYARGYSDLTFPEEYVQIFADQKGLSYAHLLATLHGKIEWRGSEAILTGMATNEVAPPDRKKPNMHWSIKSGNAIIGHALAESFGIKKNDTIQILGQDFHVENTLSQMGTNDDIRIYANLADVQKVLNKENQINEIQALDCLCIVDGTDPMTVLQTELDRLMPGQLTVVRARNIAEAREEQRQVVYKTVALIVPFIVIVCAVWVGALAMMNTRDRQQEIGILRALGYGSGKITALFMGKAIIIGILGAIIGFFIGTEIALHFGPGIFKLTAKQSLKPVYSLLLLSLIFAPAFAAISCFIPAMVAVTHDPAETLRED